MPQPYRVTVRVFNAAGEQVALLYDGTVQSLPEDWSPSGGVALPGAPVVFSFPGLLGNGARQLSWDGRNDGGQALGGGVYTVALETRDPFGSATTLSAPVTVLNAPEGAQLSVYNSAGELVYRRGLSGAAAGADRLSLDSDVFALGDKLRGRLESPAGSSAVDVWDGTNSAGRPVDTGVYTVNLELPSGSGRVVESHSVSLVAAPDTRAWSLRVAPNPWRPGRPAWVDYPGGAGRRATLRVYNLAGELMATVSDPGSGRVALPEQAWAPGLLLLELEVEEDGRRPVRLGGKLAVLR